MEKVKALTSALLLGLVVVGSLAFRAGVPLMGILAFATAPALAYLLLHPPGGAEPAPARVVGVLALMVLAHVAFHAFNIYQPGAEWDLILHVATPILVGILVLVFVERLGAVTGGLRRREAILGVVAALATISLVTLWEVYEFLFDIAFGTQAQLDNWDTMTDLTAGVIGAAIAGVVGPRLLYGGHLKGMQEEMEPAAEAVDQATGP